MVPCLCGQTTCLSCKKTVGLNTEWTYGTSQHQKEHLCSTLNSSWQQASKYQQTHSEAFFSLRLLSFQVLPVLCIFRILRLIIHPPVWLPSLAFFLIFFLFCLTRLGHQGLDFLLILVFRLLLLLLLVFMLCPLQLVLMLLPAARPPCSPYPCTARRTAAPGLATSAEAPGCAGAISLAPQPSDPAVLHRERGILTVTAEPYY